MRAADPAWHDSRWRSAIRRGLLKWFAANARELPWRSDPTPYHVWVSEIMLQQTQVATVIDYFRRFTAAYPTIADLAAADEQQLMRLWEGLGYYRRARSLHAAAKLIVERHDGRFPDDYEAVLALPGIGRYTAGAILSISGDQRLPVLEGNTVRVFSRWGGFRGDVATTAAKATLWEIATAMLPQRGAGRFNQAAMELGALVCKPKAPSCDRCPVSAFCHAHRLGLEDEIPGRVTRITYSSRIEFGFVVPIIGQDRYLVCRVPTGERWAGLWDFPRWTAGDTDSSAIAAERLSEQLGSEVRPVSALTTIRHAVTRYRITLEVHRAAAIAADSVKLPADNYRLLSRDQLGELPLSVTGRKIARLLDETSAGET